MSRARRRIAGLALYLLVAGSLIPGTAGAETHHVDDRASTVLSTTVRLRPEAPLARGPQAHVLSGDTEVIVRLDVAAWQGRPVRIYMILPEVPAGSIVASWTTRGRMIPGVLRAGDRALVYAGTLAGPRLEDTLRLHLQADGRQLISRDAFLTFTFEIDTVP